jgi:hypothetical protein
MKNLSIISVAVNPNGTFSLDLEFEEVDLEKVKLWKSLIFMWDGRTVLGLPVHESREDCELKIGKQLRCCEANPHEIFVGLNGRFVGVEAHHGVPIPWKEE